MLSVIYADCSFWSVTNKHLMLIAIMQNVIVLSVLGVLCFYKGTSKLRDNPSTNLQVITFKCFYKHLQKKLE
jgi:hypothetical protein